MDAIKNPTWISQELAKELTGVGPRRLRKMLRQNAKIVTRPAVRRSPNGKHKREILLESLSAEIQERHRESTQAAAESVGMARSQSADGVSPAAPSGDSVLIGLSEETLEEPNRKAEALREIPIGKGRSQAKESVAKRFGVTVRTVEVWLKDHEAQGPAGLVRKARSDRGISRKLPSEWTKIAAGLFLEKRTPNFMKAHRSLEKECIISGLEPPASSWTRRWIKHHLPPATIAFKRSLRKYKEDWRVKFEPCVLREKHDVIRDICDGDWHRLDTFVVDDEGINGGRPYRPFLCTIGDCCSDEIFGMQIQSTGNALGIGLALRHAILPKRDPITGQIDDRIPQACAGKFSEFYTDNGKDFISVYIGQAMHDLGGSTRQAEGYHGQSKPIERFFGSLEKDCISELPGYCGRSPQHKPHDYKPTLTRRQLFAEIYKWTFYDYHNRETKALRGLSPYGVLSSHVENGFKPVIPDERVLDLLLMPGRMVPVHKWGIEMFGTSDRRNLYQDDIFAERQLIGQKVLAKYHPDDLGTLHIYHQNQFIGAVHQEARRGYREKDMKSLYHRRKLAKRAVQNTINEHLARAQYPDELDRVRAERVYAEMEGQEQRAVAAGASRGSIHALLPKYARAAKKLRVVKNHDEGARSVSTREERRKARESDGLKSSEEIFAPIYGDEEPARSKCHQCGAEDTYDQKLHACLDCFVNPDDPCEACGGWLACTFCGDCIAKHAHVSKAEIEQGGVDYGTTVLTYREHLKAKNPDWFWLNAETCAGCGQELRKLDDDRLCWDCEQSLCRTCATAHECKKRATGEHEDESPIN